MKFEKLDNWSKDFRPDGLLYFTQRISEMLDHDTDHIFKTPVLNTYLLVDEYLKTDKMCRSGIVKEYHLTPIMQEFRSSFKEDIVIKGYIEESLKNRIVNRTTEKYKDDWNETMGYVKNLICDYNKWCKSFLFETISKDGEIKMIEQGIRCFIPGMVAFGYNKEFIHQLNAEIFNASPVNSISVLRTFLNRFDFKKRKYNVFIAIDAGVKPFRKILKELFHASFGPFKNDKGIGFNKQKYLLTKIQVSALDEYTATKKAYSILNEFFTYYCFYAEQTENWYYNNAAVTDSKGNHYIIPLKKSRQRRPIIPRTACSAINSVLTILILKKKSQDSYDKINMALKMHNTAINDPDLKNRFLDLWSVLEILFVSERDTNKLEEIKDKMLPILLKDYLCYLFTSISSAIRDLEEQIDMKSVEDLFAEKDKKRWPVLIALDEYSNQRDKLYSILTDYPLLRYRIEGLSELCHCKKDFYANFKSHSSRLVWHITRLYRTRNAIAHSGDSPYHLQELLEHLHSYADQCLVKMLILLEFNNNLRSISNFLTEIQLQKDEIVSMLEKHSSPIAKSDITRFLKK